MFFYSLSVNEKKTKYSRCAWIRIVLVYCVLYMIYIYNSRSFCNRSQNDTFSYTHNIIWKVIRKCPLFYNMVTTISWIERIHYTYCYSSFHCRAIVVLLHILCFMNSKSIRVYFSIIWGTASQQNSKHNIIIKRIIYT